MLDELASLRLLALWSLRGPTTTNDDRKGPKTNGEVKRPFLLFVQVISGLVSGLIIRRSLVRVRPAPRLAQVRGPSHGPFPVWALGLLLPSLPLPNIR